MYMHIPYMASFLNVSHLSENRPERSLIVVCVSPKEGPEYDGEGADEVVLPLHFGVL